MESPGNSQDREVRVSGLDLWSTPEALWVSSQDGAESESVVLPWSLILVSEGAWDAPETGARGGGGMESDKGKKKERNLGLGSKAEGGTFGTAWSPCLCVSTCSDHLGPC